MDKCYRIDGSELNYTDACDALQGLSDDGRLFEGSVYYECDCEEVAMTRYLRADVILEHASEAIYDEIGEASEGAFMVSGKAEKELDDFLADWAKKNLSGTYWRCIGRPREIKVTSDDVAAFSA